MPENRHLRFLLWLLYAGLALAAVHFVLPWLAPFLIALALAAALEPLVCFLTNRLRFPRWGASALCTIVLAALLAGLAGLALWRLGYEAALLLARLPALLTGLSVWLEGWVYRFLVALPVQFQDLARQALDGLLQQGTALPGRFYQALAGAVSAVPSLVLFLFTTVLATGFASARWPELKALAVRLTPERWRSRLNLGAGEMKRTLSGWLKAQGLLLLITFGELAVGLLLLRIELFLLLAALIALVDALPVFGTGAVLLPWAAGAFLSGKPGLSLGLLLLYGVITLVRNLLEPRLVGAQVGLPPLAALLAMYVGFRAFGVAGMIFAPLGAALARQLWRNARGPE